MYCLKKLWLVICLLPVQGVDAAQTHESSAQAQLSQNISIIRQHQDSLEANQAFWNLKKLADNPGSEFWGEANLWLGRIYQDGLAGAEKDPRKAFLHFEQAAGKNGLNPDAQYELGRTYFLGEGTDRNLIAAYMWTSLSLRHKSEVTQQAHEQLQKLTQLLSDSQVETAKTLVSQMATIYLSEPSENKEQ